MRQTLDRLYKTAGALAALCLIAILCLIVAQMICRWSGIAFPGATAYVGYCMASASFLAFAYALNAGSHIRVSLFLNFLGERRYWAELWCFAIGSAATVWLAYYAVEHAYGSYRWNDISQGQDKTPLWIPQIPVAAGAILLAICFLDNLYSLIRHGRHQIAASADSAAEV
ncbi:MAG: TRAP transporter small permease [Burkholderiaceae bacterium]